MTEVSVIIPVFNRVSELKRALSSALNQSLFDIEIIIVDDGSTVDISDNITCLIKKNVIIKRINSNRGVSYARNYGLRIAKGRFIAFLDSDDEWHPLKLEKQIKELNNLPESTALIGCDWECVDDAGEITRRISRPRSARLCQLLSLEQVPPPSSVVVRSSALKEMDGCFDTSLLTAEDVDLWLRLARRYDFAHLQEPLLKRWPSSGRLSCNEAKMLEGHDLFFSKHKDLYVVEGFSLQSVAEYRLARRMMGHGYPKTAQRLCFRAWRRTPLAVQYLLLCIAFSSPRLFSVGRLIARNIVQKRRIQ